MNKFNEILKTFLSFLENHKHFVKKVIVFVIAYVTLCLLNNTDLTNIFNQMFGEYVTMAIKTVPMTLLITSEV